MDGWEDVVKEFERRTEAREVKMLRIKPSIYADFKKACGGKVSEAIELCMLKFVNEKKTREKIKKL